VKKVYSRPRSLKKTHFHYCPGCGHSVAHRLICEVIDELGIQENTIGVPPPGCSVFAYNYFDLDMAETAHGRGAAVATGMKRAYPEVIVFTYQGDGDLAGIGTAETVHAANRGENITTIFINNAVYGMTGGQMAPTTLRGQKTSTTPYGREQSFEGNPIRMCEMLATIEATAYLERVSVSSPANIRKTKQAIKKAFQTQIDKLGFSMVEILSPCPTNWKMSPLQSWEWIEKEMARTFPLGVFKDITGKKDAH